MLKFGGNRNATTTGATGGGTTGPGGGTGAGGAGGTAMASPKPANIIPGTLIAGLKSAVIVPGNSMDASEARRNFNVQPNQQQDEPMTSNSRVYDTPERRSSIRLRDTRAVK